MGWLGAIVASVTDGVSFQGKMAIYIANVIAGCTPFFFKDFEEEHAELKSELTASVLERRESSFIKKESRSFVSSEGNAVKGQGYAAEYNA